MKKLSIAVLGMFAFVSIARANYQETVVTETVVVSEPVMSVSQVKNMADNAPVVIRGNILRSLGDDKYLFRDATGSITVEIDGNDWRGIEVTEYDTVKLQGSVDKGTNGIMVEVDYLEKI